MTVGVVQITDRNFRITIPYEIRCIENLKQGDYIQIDITKLDLKEQTNNTLKVLVQKLNELPDKIKEAIKNE